MGLGAGSYLSCSVPLATYGGSHLRSLMLLCFKKKARIKLLLLLYLIIIQPIALGNTAIVALEEHSATTPLSDLAKKG